MTERERVMSELKSLISSATDEEIIEMADEIHDLYTRMESVGGKSFMKEVEEFARNQVKKEPTSVTAEISKKGIHLRRV